MDVTIEEFVGVLNKRFTEAILAMPPQNVPELTGWTPEQVLEKYRECVQATLDWANGIAP